MPGVIIAMIFIFPEKHQRGVASIIGGLIPLVFNIIA